MRQTDIGRHVRSRRIEPADRDALTRFYAGLSQDSRESRFHGARPGIADTEATYFCGPDHEHREGLVAIAREHGAPVIVGHLCLEPVNDHEAEMAIAVADAWQGRGLGTALLAEAAAWAAEHGVTRLCASMRAGDAVISALVRSTGHPVQFAPAEGGEVEAVIDLTTEAPAAA
jgi:GNAT superfamily N-acetyltransferase